MIEAVGLTKRYGRTVAVDDLSFTVQSGRVTGFLGPNGAGKSTTMRMILGLDAPTAGRVSIDGKRYRELHNPLRMVGALLDAKWVHPNRSARAHLRWLAKSNKLSPKRVDEVLDLVGLDRRGEPPRRRVLARHVASGSASRPRCSATRRCCCSTSRSTASTRRASSGSAGSCTASPTRAGPCSCPATCSRRWRSPRRTSSSSAAAS